MVQSPPFCLKMGRSQAAVVVVMPGQVTVSTGVQVTPPSLSTLSSAHTAHNAVACTASPGLITLNNCDFLPFKMRQCVSVDSVMVCGAAETVATLVGARSRLWPGPPTLATGSLPFYLDL